MDPAAIVISKFGGVRATARKLEVNPSTVCRWGKAASEGGTDGKVPQKYFKQIMTLVPELTLHELVFGS